MKLIIKLANKMKQYILCNISQVYIYITAPQ